ncbi:MAG TPA: hypothetical protein VKM72_11795 [Thermoanaerobaculia bacterium]|nr:hypothetical protein [Thermoanaerobaculia bacterium]
MGPRGIGKSTVLAALRSDLEHSTEGQTRRLILLPILDAAVVHDDLGLAAATIRELYRTIEKKEPPAGARDRSHELREELDRSFKHCFESALLQEESHRRLAQELAMTPGHYGKIVSEANDRKHHIGTEFGKFLNSLLELHRAHSLLVPVDIKQAPAFVVLVDDLDLGPSRAVLRWVRSLLTDYCDPRVCWILAFHREPLIRLLSLPPEGDDRIEASPTNGQALLGKAVPSSRQWELRRWTAQERQEFRPLPSNSGNGKTVPELSTLRDLLTKAGRGELLTLLPAHPRALEGEYVRLLQSEDPLSAEEMLRRIALVSGEAELVRRLDQRGAALLGSSLFWQGEERGGEAGWQALVEAARTDNPLWGFQLPEDFSKLVSGPDPEAYLETLLDIALAEGRLTPYQLLQKLPFTRTRLKGAQSELRIPEPGVLHYFSPESTAATELVSTALSWQRWSDDADKDRFWTVFLNPTDFWELCLDQRTASPESLFKTLSLERIPVAPRPAGTPAFLPNRLRPLILLVDGLSRSAWQALSTARTFWSPLTFTRCAAAFTLAGYVRHRPLGREEEIPKLLRLTNPMASRDLLALNDADVEIELARLMGWLERQTQEAAPVPPSTPAELAAKELNTALAAFLSLPGVARLAPRSPA